jgi:hypothetical protein
MYWANVLALGAVTCCAHLPPMFATRIRSRICARYAVGQVTGNSTTASGNSEHFVRFSDDRGLEDLGGAGEHNTAWGINTFGHVVGCRGQSSQRAVRYTDVAGLQDLNALIDPSLG